MSVFRKFSKAHFLLFAWYYTHLILGISIKKVLESRH